MNEWVGRWTGSTNVYMDCKLDRWMDRCTGGEWTDGFWLGRWSDRLIFLMNGCSGNVIKSILDSFLFICCGFYDDQRSVSRRCNKETVCVHRRTTEPGSE